MTRKIIILLCLIVSMTTVQAQDSKKRIDYLKEHIPYPKYNMGDTVYVWLQTCPDMPDHYQPGIEIKSYKIIDIALTNTGVYKHNDTFSLSYCEENKDEEYASLYKIEFKYQLRPCDAEPKMKNVYPVLQKEDRLFATYEECLADSQKEE